MTTINSLQNQRVKDAIKLRDRRGRLKQSRTILDGTREILHATQRRFAIVEAFVCPSLGVPQEVDEVVQRLTESGTQISLVSPPVFEKLSFGSRAEGVVAVAQTPQLGLDHIKLGANPLVVVLEAMEKPGNVGAVLRTADAVGASAAILTDPATDLFNPNIIRSSLGAVFTVPVCETTNSDCLAWLRQNGIAIYAARVEGSTAYTRVSYRGPCCLVLGAEACGLSDCWQTDEVTGIFLPMLGAVDSLNVSATAAVLMYEALRQRQ